MSSSYVDDCSSPLGVQIRKQIPDNKLMALSTFQDDFKQFGPQRGRLHSSSAYRADPHLISKDGLVSGAFIIVLPQEKIVTAVATQGFKDEWVTKYQLVFYPGDGGPSTITEVRSSEVHLFTFNENRVDHVVILVSAAKVYFKLWCHVIQEFLPHPFLPCFHIGVKSPPQMSENLLLCYIS